MLRHEWKFSYKPEEVLDMANARLNYHTERLAYWTGEVGAREKKLRDEGIQLRSAVKPQPSHLNSAAGYRQEIQYDNALMQDFQEAQDKMIEHQRASDDYKRWCNALHRHCERSGPNVMMELTIDDLQYFGLA